MNQKNPPKLYLLILTIQSIFMLAAAIGPFIDGHFDFSLMPFAWHKSLGFLLNFTGFLFVFAAVATMRGSFTVFVKPRKEGELVQSGVFALCRNPIYFGGLLMCFGWGVSFQSTISIVSSVVLIPVLLWKVSYEEVELLNLYGDAYRNYKSSTKKLLPFVF